MTKAEFYGYDKEFSNPALYHTFDMIAFIYHLTTIQWIYGAMEIQLDEFKKRSNDANKINEAEDKIHQLRHTYSWIARLQNEYNAMQKVSLENNLTNLVLTNKVKELEAENEKLKKVINATT